MIHTIASRQKGKKSWSPDSEGRRKHSDAGELCPSFLLGSTLKNVKGPEGGYFSDGVCVPVKTREFPHRQESREFAPVSWTLGKTRALIHFKIFIEHLFRLDTLLRPEDAAENETEDPCPREPSVVNTHNTGFGNNCATRLRGGSG